MKRKMLVECLEIAHKNATPDKHPQYYNYLHFSFVIQNNKILEWGTNRKSSPLTHLGYADYTKMHSEVDCYYKAKGLLEKNVPFEVVNIRLNRNHLIRHSNPCRCCFGFLKNMGCKRIYFSTNIGNFAVMDLT